MKTIDEMYKTSDDYEIFYNICLLGWSAICIVNYTGRFETLFINNKTKNTEKNKWKVKWKK